jgi:hypothetical protein
MQEFNYWGGGQYFVFISECYLNGRSKLSCFGVENNIEKHHHQPGTSL